MASKESYTNHGPMPAPSTSAAYYQSRVGVGPTSTPGMKFNNPNEGGKRALYQGTVMPYTDINGSAPSSMERGNSAPQGDRK